MGYKMGKLQYSWPELVLQYQRFPSLVAARNVRMEKVATYARKSRFDGKFGTISCDRQLSRAQCSVGLPYYGSTSRVDVGLLTSGLFLLSMMYRANWPRVNRIPMFHKPAIGVRKILLLIMVFAVSFLVYYRVQALESVREHTTLSSQPNGLQQVEADNRNSEIDTLAASDKGNPTEDSPSGQTEEKTPFRSDEPTTESPHSYFVSHKTAEDVSLVVAKSGSEQTDWIEKFCAD